jgi:hypothetical protein
MCTVTLSYDKRNAKARDLLASIIESGLFYVNEEPEKKDRVYVEDGEVKLDIVEDSTDIEDFRDFLHKMVELEYSLP